MKLSTNVSLSAVALLLGSMGVLYPVHTKISNLEQEVEQLEAATAVDTGIQEQLVVISAQIAALEQRAADRSYGLCPDTPEARKEFETELSRKMHEASLSRISMDRQNGNSLIESPCFTVDLVVEGTAQQIFGFLRGIETLPWVTRVLKLEVQSGGEPGSDQRRIAMQIAVLLETDS